MKFKIVLTTFAVLLIPALLLAIENQFELNGFWIHQYKSAIEGSLGKPFKTGESDQFTWAAHEFDEKSYMVFQFYKGVPDRIYSMQITGKSSTMLPFNGIVLGAISDEVEKVLGAPDEIREIEKPKLKYYIYENKNFSVEFDPNGNLYSIKISIYPEIYNEVDKKFDYWTQFKKAVSDKDYLRVSKFFRPDAKVYISNKTLDIDKAFVRFFQDTSTDFFKAILSEKGSVYEELLQDESEREIRVLEKVGVGFVHKFYFGKILTEIVFIPYANQYRIYEIAFK